MPVGKHKNFWGPGHLGKKIISTGNFTVKISHALCLGCIFFYMQVINSVKFILEKIYADCDNGCGGNAQGLGQLDRE